MSETKAVQKVGDFVKEHMQGIRDVASPLVNVENLAMRAVILYSRDSKLSNCSYGSFVAAIKECASTGLIPETGANSPCYFTPRGNQVRFQISYIGLVQLLLRHPNVRQIFAEIVCENDEFEYGVGYSGQSISHVPKFGDRGKMKLAYAVAVLGGGFRQCSVLDAEHIEKRRSKSAQKETGVWKEWPEAMWKKCAVRELSKWLPMQPEAMSAISHDENAELGLPSSFSIPTEERVFDNRTDALADRVKSRKKKEPVDVTTPKEEPQTEGDLWEEGE
jgi:recombination protein RecT